MYIMHLVVLVYYKWYKMLDQRSSYSSKLFPSSGPVVNMHGKFTCRHSGNSPALWFVPQIWYSKVPLKMEVYHLLPPSFLFSGANISAKTKETVYWGMPTDTWKYLQEPPKSPTQLWSGYYWTCAIEMNFPSHSFLEHPNQPLCLENKGLLVAVGHGMMLHLTVCGCSVM